MSTDDDIPMPEGNGDKNCPKCRGRGVVSMDVEGWPGGAAQNCDCVFRRDLVSNVKRVWQVLLSVESVEFSPLLAMTGQSLWITASNYALRRHLRYVAFRMGTQWDARVIADATLMTAWLSTAKNVKDPDVLTMREDETRDRPSDHFMTLVDLAVPFDLLIIRLGVKAAKNREMSNVLIEAINERELIGKPTWVVDSPTKPLGPGHICYSDMVVDLLEGFRRVVLKEDAPVVHGVAASYQPAGQLANPYTQGAPQFSTALPTAPRQTPKAIPLVDVDDDEFSVDNLIDAAADVVIPVAPDVPDTAFDPKESLEDYPSEEELRSNGTPSWVSKRALTMDDRKTAQAKAKKEKQWDKKRGGK